MLHHLLASAMLACALASAAPAADDEKGFKPIFKGKDLTDWDGKPGWWYVEDGALTSQSTKEKPCKGCNYLIWRGGKPADFELRCLFRLSEGDGSNSGIQFRSQERPNWDTSGYQADMNGGAMGYMGCLYEHTRGLVSARGQKTVIDEQGKKQITPLGDPKELKQHVKPNDWNEYRVIARGPDITLVINGQVMTQVTDRQVGRAARDGIIALQMHPGPPMKVQFKDLRIKTLP